MLEKNGVNHFGWNVIDLSKFPNILLLFILHFGGNISNRSRCDEISQISCCRFPFLCLLIIACFCILFKALPS
jgi:hypothetical protein